MAGIIWGDQAFKGPGAVRKGRVGGFGGGSNRRSKSTAGIGTRPPPPPGGQLLGDPNWGGYPDFVNYSATGVNDARNFEFPAWDFSNPTLQDSTLLPSLDLGQVGANLSDPIFHGGVPGEDWGDILTALEEGAQDIIGGEGLGGPIMGPLPDVDELMPDWGELWDEISGG